MSPLFLVSGLGMMAVALVVVAYWRRRERVACRGECPEIHRCHSGSNGDRHRPGHSAQLFV